MSYFIKFAYFLFNYKLSASYEICTRDFQRPIRYTVSFILQQKAVLELITSRWDWLPSVLFCTAVILGFLFPVILRIPFASPFSAPYCCNYCGFTDIWFPHIKILLTVFTVYMNFRVSLSNLKNSLFFSPFQNVFFKSSI